MKTTKYFISMFLLIEKYIIFLSCRLNEIKFQKNKKNREKNKNRQKHDQNKNCRDKCEK